MTILHRMLTTIAVSCAAFIILSCNEGPTVVQTLTGQYSYTAFDSSGTAVARGELFLERRDSVHLVGRWGIDSIGHPGSIGPQVGEGMLAGNISHDTAVFINLNPQYADNNVFLNGVIRADSIKGIWFHSTLTGNARAGTFIARKLLLAI